MYKLTLALGLLSSAFAAQTTTTLLLLGFDNQSIVGSVISTDATATTYALSCPSGEDSSDCGVPPNFIFTQGPSTMHYEYTLDVGDTSPGTVEADCQITSDHGFCSSAIVSAGPSMFGGAGTAFQYSNFGTDIGAQVVTIVQAGAAPGATASSTVASTLATTTSGAAGQTASSESGNKSSGSSTATSSPTGSSTARSSVSTGGVLMVTGHPQWVIGGAAAAVAIAAM